MSERIIMAGEEITKTIDAGIYNEIRDDDVLEFLGGESVYFKKAGDYAAFAPDDEKFSISNDQIYA